MNVRDHNKTPAEVHNWIGRQLFEFSPSSIAVIDRDYKILLANKRFKAVFGEPNDKHCYEVYKNRDSICEDCMASRTFKDGKMRVNDEEGFDKNCLPAHYVVNIAPVYNEVGEVTHIIEMSYDVTETKSLQKEYNILFERVPCYVAVINRDLRIVRANDLLNETFGKTVGKNCYQVLKHRSEQCPDCPALKTFGDGKTYKSEHIGIDKYGLSTNYIVTTAPLARSGKDFSHVIEMSLDVTDIHKLSGKLEQELDFRNILTENSPHALIAVDENGLINIFNPAAEALLNISANQVIGKSKARPFLPPEFLTAMDEGQTSLFLRETYVTDNCGHHIPVSLFGTILYDHEAAIGGALFIQDLREIKQLEKEKLDSERMASVGQTVAQLAHGVKNILTGLRGGMYVIKSGLKSNSSKRTQKGWEMLDRNVSRITTLVRGFLNFSKSHTPEIKPTDPDLIAQEIYELYAETAKQRGIVFDLELKQNPREENLDPEDIHTCLANLVSNALDACQASGKDHCAVLIRVHEQDDALCFDVSDTGCGMDQETKQKVLNSFFTTKGLGGTGLGLLVTKKLIKEH
ncbi:PAS domain-containing protein, partial [candidate division CSSED10-310 bacterium]